MRCAAGADAERSAKILLVTCMIVATIVHISNSYLPLVYTRLLVTARINRHKQDVQCKYEANNSHDSKINDKTMQ